MEVILRKDIANLGYANDLVNVKNGYARNYLIPKGLVNLATDNSKKIRKETLKQKAYKEEKLRNEAEAIAKNFEGITLKIGAKAGTSGKIFGSVNTIQISEAIREQLNLEIDRKTINFDGDSIKELGTYSATAKLYKDIEAIINFEVVSE